MVIFSTFLYIDTRSEHNPLGILDEGTVLWTQGKGPTDNKSDDHSNKSYLTSAVAQNIALYNR